MNDDNLNILNEIEENERWLAGFASPELSSASIASVKSAVRSELARERGLQFARRWRPWQGAMAAAAMLLLSVGVIRYASLHTDTTSTFVVQATIDELSLVGNTETSIEDDSLDALSEMAIGESWALSGSSMYETFEAAFSELDEGESGEAGAMMPQFNSDEAIG